MEEKIELIYGNETEGTSEVLNKLKTAQKILELLETRDVVSIDVTYKERESAVECQLSNS